MPSKRSILACAAAACLLGAFGQEMRLLSGALTVEQGTTMRLSDGTVWTIASGAQVVNDGRIELGAAALINEPIGGPITGSGTERISVAAGDAQPALGHGGLGLRIEQGAPLPSLTVTRGHLPRTDATLGVSMARWYRLEGGEQLSPGAELIFHYDETELGALSEVPLGLARSIAEEGPWSAMPSEGQPDLNAVNGPYSPGGGHFSVFAFDPLSASAAAPTAPGLVAWPSITDGPLTIGGPAGAVLGDLRIVDGTGRVVMRFGTAGQGASRAIDASALPAGAYVLVAGGGSVRFVKR
jgi:hypothetical protein